MTFTLDTEQLEELRPLVDARSLSSTVDQAVGAHLSRLRHLRAVDGWLAELEAQHGPVDPETLECAARISAFESQISIAQVPSDSHGSAGGT